MKHYTTVSVCCAALAALSVHAQAHAQVQAQSSTGKEETCPYIGAALGAAFGNGEIDDSNGKISKQVNSHALTVGTRFKF